MSEKATDPRPVPLPSVWGFLLAVLVPALYLVWRFVAIPTASLSDEVSRSEELSYAILRTVTQLVAPAAVVLGIIGVIIVRRDPHLYRWQWVGFVAIAFGSVELVLYLGSWLGWW